MPVAGPRRPSSPPAYGRPIPKHPHPFSIVTGKSPNHPNPLPCSSCRVVAVTAHRRRRDTAISRPTPPPPAIHLLSSPSTTKFELKDGFPSAMDEQLRCLYLSLKLGYVAGDFSMGIALWKAGSSGGCGIVPIGPCSIMRPHCMQVDA